MNKLLRGLALAAGVTLAAAPASVLAQATNFPSKSVTFILPFTPGGESDMNARFQQAQFKPKFHQDLIIQYKPGAGGAVAWGQLNNLPGDGYTVMGANLPHMILQPLEGNVAYRTEDMTPVHFNHFTPDAIVVPADSPYQAMQDLLAAARAKPGDLTFAGSGSNSANHLAHERFNLALGVKTTYVPFKGTGDLVSSLIGKHVSAAMTYLPLAIAQKDKVRLLAVATERRHPLFPNVPTFREVGMDWADGAFRGIAVPKSAPEDVRRRLSDMFDAINKEPAYRKQMIDNGFEIVDITYDRMPAFMKERSQVYTGLAKRLGMGK